MADGRDDVPYDWNKVINPEAKKKPAKRPPGKGPALPKMPRVSLKLDLLGWLMAVTGVVIVVGILVLFYMSWLFQAEGQRVTAQDQGQIPITEDFAAGEPKPADVLFRIGGASSMGQSVTMDLVSAWMRVRGYSSVRAEQGDKVIEVTGSRGGKNARVLIALGSSHGGFEALTQQRLEAVMSSRQVLPGEADRLSALGNFTNASSEKIIGLDASLVVVNRNNPVNRIDTE
ncbi:MAG: hypothetical protein ACK5BF_10050, partial [Hyphomonadaceae bacterium]